MSSRTTIRDLIGVRNADQLTMYINDFDLYKILNQSLSRMLSGFRTTLIGRFPTGERINLLNSG